jgi:SAM-dependent methyltransferase
MYGGDMRRYFEVITSAASCIDAALSAAGRGEPRAILDMGCGFGRVVRGLVAAYPHASVTACDIRPAAVRFCVNRFGARPELASSDFEQMTFDEPFDLIWCGSLATHLPAARTLALIDLFARSARPGAVIVFTTHGRPVIEAMKAGANYMLSPSDRLDIRQSYDNEGYGYADYGWERGYGIAVISPDWIRANVGRRSGLEEIYFAEQGWDVHQDVFGFQKRC